MARTLIRHDVEGALLYYSDSPPPRLVKQLSTEVAWQVFDPRDLERAAGSVVESVQIDVDQRVHNIHYRPDLEPLELSLLREMLRLDGPLAPWRAARLAADLFAQLRALHEEEIPQLVIHPERVGLLQGRLVLMPTLAGVLPPFSSVKSCEVAGWLHYAAPDVLRTRGTDQQLLYAGDVYSLGRMLHLLCLPSWEPDGRDDPLTLAERRVEHPQAVRLPELPPGFEELAGLIGRACACVPEERPSLEEIVQELQGLLQRLAPEAHFARLLGARQLDRAEAVLGDLDRGGDVASFGLPEPTRRVMAADLAMSHAPPDCGRALVELQRLEARHLYDGEVQRRIGRAYALHLTYPQHWQHSAEAYHKAAVRLQWRPDVLAEWMDVLQQIRDPKFVVDRTRQIPSERRTRSVVRLRAFCLLQTQAALDAWYEIAAFFPRCPFDEELFQLATQVAERNSPLKLIEWMYRLKDTRGYDAPLSIVWQRNGNAAKAARHYVLAREYQPPAET